MAHTGTHATQRRALAKESLVFCQPRANYLACAPKCIASTTQKCQSFRLLYRRRRRRLGSPWLGPINANLKRLKLSTVTPSVTSFLSASFTSSFLCRVLDPFFSSTTHAALNLQPPLHTVLNQTAGSSAAVLQPPVMPNTRRSSDTQSALISLYPAAPVFPCSLAFPTRTSWQPVVAHAEQRHRPRMNLLVRTAASIPLRMVCWRASL